MIKLDKIQFKSFEYKERGYDLTKEEFTQKIIEVANKIAEASRTSNSNFVFYTSSSNFNSFL